MSSGMVAENSMDWRSRGNSATSLRTSRMKPMLHKTIEAGFAKETVLKLYYLADGAEAALEILEGALNAPARS